MCGSRSERGLDRIRHRAIAVRAGSEYQHRQAVQRHQHAHIGQRGNRMRYPAAHRIHELDHPQVIERPIRDNITATRPATNIRIDHRLQYRQLGVETDRSGTPAMENINSSIRMQATGCAGSAP